MSDPGFNVPWVFGQVVSTLAQLPLNATLIERHLFGLGHRGFRGSRSACALNIYLHSKTDAAKYDVRVELDAGAVYVEQGGISFSWALPPHLEMFLNGYDYGAYPDLYLPTPEIACHE